MPDNKKNDNDFGKMLGRIVLNRLEESKEKFKETVEIVKKKVSKSIDDESEQIYNFKDELKACKNYVEIYAAASYLCEYIFNGSNRCFFNNNGKFYRTYMHTRKHIKFKTIHASEWGRKKMTFKQKIDDILKDESPKLIYMFWSRRNVKYFYVGITKRGAKRFSWHESAFSCAGESEKLTIINLDKSNLLEKVEACIIRILGLKGEKAGKSALSKYKNDILEYNGDYGKVSSLKSLKCNLDKNYTELKTLIENIRKLKESRHKRLSEADKILNKMQEIEKQIYKI